MGVKKVGNHWIMDTYAEGGRRIRVKAGRTKREAEKALAAVTTDAIRGNFNLPRHSKLLFRDYAEDYIKNCSEKKKRRPERDRVAFVHILPFFGNYPISKIHKFLIDQYVEKRKAEIKPATVNRELSIIKHMLGRAEEMGLLKTNPARWVKPLPVPPTEHTTLTEEQKKALLEAARDDFRPVIATALNVGLRKGDILKLTWKNIDLQSRIIHLIESKTQKERWIPVNATLYGILKALNDGTKSEADYVFKNRNTGRPFVSFYPLWYKSLHRAGLKRIHFHEMRHNFGTHLIEMGVNPVDVRDLLGHESLATTQIYLHSTPSSQREAVARLDKISTEEKIRPNLGIFSVVG